MIPTINGGADLRVAAYIRVSTDEQAEEGYSIESQRHAIRAYCETYRWKTVEWYVDEGYSAYSGERRPAFERMMAEADRWDIAIGKWLNRFWRRVLPALSWAQEMQRQGKDFACVVDRIDTSTAMGRAMFQMMLVMGELESGQTSERVRAALATKFESDSSAWFSRPPIGYDMVDGRLIVNETDAPIIRQIFDMAASGVPTMKIVTRLNAKGLHGKAGGKWSQVQVLQVLHNAAYAGFVHFAGVLKRNGHPAIIPLEMFNRVSVALYTRTRKHERWPLVLGDGRLEVRRITTAGKGAAMYTPKVRPAGLDRLVADEAIRGIRQKVRPRP